MEKDWFYFALAIAVNFVVVVFGYGRLSQRVSDEKERLDRVQGDVREVRVILVTMLGKGSLGKLED